MTNKWIFMSAVLFAASIICLPVMAQEAARPRKAPKPNPSIRTRIVVEVVTEVVKEAIFEVMRDASHLAPPSVRPYVKDKPLSEVFGRVHKDAQKNFADCASAGGCR